MQRLIAGMNDEEGNLTDLSDLTDLTVLYASHLGGGDVLRFMAVEGDCTVIV